MNIREKNASTKPLKKALKKVAAAGFNRAAASRNNVPVGRHAPPCGPHHVVSGPHPQRTTLQCKFDTEWAWVYLCGFASQFATQFGPIANQTSN